MVQNDKSKNNSKTKIVVISVIALAVVAAAVVCIVMARSKYLATTMRLLKVEGTVNIEDSKGGTKPVVDNMRFQSGDALNTGADGLASVGLDDTKIVTLDNDSRAEFIKNRKQLELKLTKGALFVNVSQKLNADEKFEIKTSSMTAGIRGTTVVVYYDPKDNMRETLALLEGALKVSATNSVTNETKSIDLTAGQQIKVYLYPDRTTDSVEFFVTEITESDLTNFTYQCLEADMSVVEKILGQNSSWNKDKLNQFLRDLEHAGTDLDKQPDEQPPKTNDTEPPKTVDPDNKPSEDPKTEEPEPEPVPEKKPVPKKKTPSKKKKTVTYVKKKPTGMQPPSGYAKTSFWKKRYNGHSVDIAKRKSGTSKSKPLYKGYLRGKWISLKLDKGEDGGTYYYFYSSSNPDLLYYEYFKK